MHYTINQVAKISGVSSKTLRHYDAISLLKPAFKGENQYRYYGIDELLQLQQILFYRELKFPLSEIKRIVTCERFDKLEALQTHADALKKDIEHKEQLLDTIFNTIRHLRGQKTMKNEELYYGFDSEIQKKHEQTLVEKGIVSQEMIIDSHQKLNGWSDQDKNNYLVQGEKIMSELILAIEDGKLVDEKSVQATMNKHYQWLSQSWTPSKEKYQGLAELYQSDDFAEFFMQRHPKLLSFIVGAMKVYAEKSLG